MSNFNKYKEYRNLQKVKPQSPVAHITAGENAENLVMDLLEEKFLWKEAQCFSNKRVPRLKKEAGKGNKAEIDIIIITRKFISIIEVKNWSGQLYSDFKNDKWIHQKKMGDIETHDDLVKQSNEKLFCLKSYLKKNKIEIKDQIFSNKVLFYNKNLYISKDIQNIPNVINFNQLNEFFDERKTVSFSKRILISLIEFLLDRESSDTVLETQDLLNTRNYNKIINVIDELQSWDYLKIFGGKKLKGDVLDIDLKEYPNFYFDRSKDLTYKVKWDRSIFFSYFKTVFFSSHLGYLTIPSGEIDLLTDDKIIFQGAGQKNKEEISLAELTSISLSKIKNSNDTKSQNKNRPSFSKIGYLNSKRKKINQAKIRLLIAIILFILGVIFLNPLPIILSLVFFVLTIVSMYKSELS